jgi:hypothetical protein
MPSRQRVPPWLAGYQEYSSIVKGLEIHSQASTLTSPLTESPGSVTAQPDLLVSYGIQVAIPIIHSISTQLHLPVPAASATSSKIHHEAEVSLDSCPESGNRLSAYRDFQQGVRTRRS